MNILEINNTGQENYTLRNVVKLVVINKDEKIHHLTSGLIGGGLEIGEDFLDALAREVLEEAGYTVQIIRELGCVVAYRDILKMKYITRGYLVKLLEKGVPTTTQQDEISLKVIENSLADAIQYFKNQIVEIENNKSIYKGDAYQSKLFNSVTALAFLEQL